MSNPKLRTAIQLGKASIGKETASIGFTIARSRIAVPDAVSMFVGARITAAFSQDEDTEQGKLDGMEGDKLESVVDVNALSIKVDTITGTFKFQKTTVNPHAIADFAQRQVLLEAERIGDAVWPEEGGSEDTTDEALKVAAVGTEAGP